ncbi:kinetochore protein SPC24 homolog isoform X2 [Mangifera indica]|uniref:kinetochore protein SPC24 homolog isoform X2 n=1 Tax=Mangifera indica TaxID=29780 RepID=UPI001CFB8928|nr:kinetochore protein SPC24 homolog isoform X2 [Mangifera indica]
MEGITRTIDVEKLFCYSDDLVEVLKDRKDLNSLTQCLDHSKSLHSSCEADFNSVLNSIQDYEKKIEVCKQKTERAKSEVAAEAEVDHLQKELEEELEKERALQEELRAISNEIKGLERERIAIEEQKRACKKSEKDKLRVQMKLSMYASVTNIIPNLDDQSKISGYIVDRSKNVIEKFEYDPAKMTTYDTCDNMWKTINLW